MKPCIKSITPNLPYIKHSRVTGPGIPTYIRSGSRLSELNNRSGPRKKMRDLLNPYKYKAVTLHYISCESRNCFYEVPKLIS